jgi:hypothetical protein
MMPVERGMRWRATRRDAGRVNDLTDPVPPSPVRETGLIVQSRLRPSLDNVEALILGLTALGGLLLVAADVYQRWIGDRTWVLDIDGRFNPTTWFHSFVLAGAACSALLIALTRGEKRKSFRLWLAIGITFAFLSLDKSISFHERVGENIEDAIDGAEQSGRIIWQLVYGPFLVGLVVALHAAVRGTRLARWAYAAIALAASKIALEALMFPAIHFGLTSEAGVLYGIEVNIEESLQLLGFGFFFAVFARLAVDAIGVSAVASLGGRASSTPRA